MRNFVLAYPDPEPSPEDDTVYPARALRVVSEVEFAYRLGEGELTLKAVTLPNEVTADITVYSQPGETNRFMIERVGWVPSDGTTPKPIAFQIIEVQCPIEYLVWFILPGIAISEVAQ